MPKRLRSHSRATLVLLGILGLAACTAPAPQVPTEPVATAPKNIIFFLGDGMGAAQVKAYRAFADDPQTPIIEPLAFDGFLVGAVATDTITLDCATEDPASCERDPYGIADSAATATAYATGRDTANGMLALGPDGERYTTVLERAAQAGMGTGVVATSQITHASPAAFVVHVPARRDYEAIADQFHDNQIDGRPVAQVILGGGVADFRREDRDVAAEMVEGMGYELLGDADALEAAGGDRLLGLFAPVGLPRHWDRPESVPSLAAMTRKAIATLSRNEHGFFLFVEGSQIDWAAHGNDIAGVISEMEGFHEAVNVGLDFAMARDDTLVIVTADHETGGLSIARDYEYLWNPRPLRALDATPALMAARYLESDAPLSAIVEQSSRLTLSDAERTRLDTTERDPDVAFEVLADWLSERSRTGWTTSGHTGVDVPIYAYGPGSRRFSGTLENEVVGQRLMEWIPAGERQ